MPKVSALSYRADLDGLRAFAVVSVFLFHIKNSWLPGGFTGVDVFFVISGYLITTIIYNQLTRGSFDLRTFYAHRLRRIQPVLWVVIAGTFLVSLLIFLPSDLEFFSSSVRSTLSFTSNFFFASNVDYFNPTSEEYPLLHTWSLAVEEQYYLVWPLLLLLLARSRRRYRMTLLTTIVILLLSFVGSEVLLRMGLYSKYVYYMLPSRMGELAIGALLAILQCEHEALRKFKSHALSLCGFALLCFALFAFDARTPFPGVNALVPCLGAVFLIAAGGDSLVNRLLGWKPLVWVGGLSYSLYLWHYPLLAFAKYMNLPKLVSAAVAVVLAFVLAWWSKRWVEDRFRRREVSFGRAVWSFWLKPVALLLIAVLIAHDSGGLPQRYFFSLGSVVADVAPFYPSYCHQQMVGDCVIGSGARPPKVLLYGDSHAGQFFPFFDQLGKRKGFSLYARSASSCHGVFAYLSENSFCRSEIDWVKAHYREFSTIILGERWERVFEDQKIVDAFIALFKTYQEAGIRVIVLEQIPKVYDREYEFGMRNKYRFLGLWPAPDFVVRFDPTIDAVNARVRGLVQPFANVSIFDPIAELPEFRARLPYLKNGMAYKDGNHINAAGARELAAAFLAAGLPLPFTSR